MKNKVIILIVLGILLFLCFLVGSSYAYWMMQDKQSGENIVSSSCLDISFGEYSNAIILTNTSPIADDNAKSLDPYSFGISNTCDTIVKYFVNLEILNTSSIDSNFVKAMVNLNPPQIINNYGEVTPTIENAKAYNLVEGYLLPHENENYNLRIYLDENANYEEVFNKQFVSKIVVNAVAVDSVPSLADMCTNKNLADCMLENKDKLPDQIHYNDPDGNARFYGKNARNYVEIDGQLWYIIGSFNNVDNGSGIKENRVKLIKKDPLYNITWNRSNVEGTIRNDWTTSDVMRILNPGFESDSDCNSLFWNRASGKCYDYDNSSDTYIETTYDFTELGMTDKAKELIDLALWDITAVNEFHDVSVESFYLIERNRLVQNVPFETLDRPITWKGYVGLISISDYFYSIVPNKCSELPNEIDYDKINCSDSTWFDRYESTMHTMMSDGSSNFSTYYISPYNGRFSAHGSGNSDDLIPCVYLKHNVKLASGSGTRDNPFILDLE